MWHERHEMSIKEICKETGLSRNEVNWALESGLKKLRDGRAREILELHEELSVEEAGSGYKISVTNPLLG